MPLSSQKQIKVLTSSGKTHRQRAKITANVKVGEFEHGQSCLTAVATLESGQRVDTSQNSPVGTPKQHRHRGSVGARTLKEKFQVVNLRPSFKNNLTRPITSVKNDISSIFLSFKGIVKEIEAKFHQPDVIDERKKIYFAEVAIPNAPPLKIAEIRVLDKVGDLESNLETNGRRIKGNVKEDIDKYQWKEGTTTYAAFAATLDKSPKGVLAELFEMETYERAARHKIANKNLPRLIKKSKEETRSLHYLGGKYMLAYGSRLFENWFVWRNLELSNGKQGYQLGFVPMGQYKNRSSFKDFTKQGYVFGEARGLYTITEEAPNVSRVTRVQTVYLHAKGLPETVVDYLARSQLVEANRLQEKFRRNGKKVDAEVREVLSKQMQEGIGLSDDQIKVFSDLENLFGPTEEGWTPLTSSYQGVQIEAKLDLQTKKRSIVLGKAQATADCTAEEAAAWYFEYNSRVRAADARDEGPARLEIRKREVRVNEKKFADVKNVPFPLVRREFVIKHLWRRNIDGSISIAVQSLPTAYCVDYGASLGRTIRASCEAIFTATNIEGDNTVPQCNLVLRQRLDAGGTVPVWLMNIKAKLSLGGIGGIVQKFKQDELTDAAHVASLAKIIKEKSQDYSLEEEALVRRGKNFLEKIQEGHKKLELKSPDNRVKMTSVTLEEETIASGIATTTVDATPEECAASQYYGTNSRRQRELDKTNNVYQREVSQVNEHKLHWLTRRDMGVLRFAPREFKVKLIWKKEDNGNVYLFIFSSDDNVEDFKPSAKCVTAAVETVWLFEPMQAVGTVAQTRVTFASKVDLKGFIPSAVMNLLTINFLASASNLRKQFDKSKEIDASNRSVIVRQIGNISSLTRKSFEERFQPMAGEKKVENALPTADSWVQLDKMGRGWGKATVTCKASLEEAAAFFWDYDSGHFRTVSGDVERKVKERPAHWEAVVWKKSKLQSKHGGSHRLREFWNSMTLHKVDNDTFVITLEPLKKRTEGFSRIGVLSTSRLLARGSSKKEALTATETVSIRITRVGTFESKVEYVIALDVGKGVSEAATRMALEKQLAVGSDVGRYFARLTKLEDMTASDGNIIGGDMVWNGSHLGGQISRKNKKQFVDEMCKESAALREVVERYPWFVTLLKRARLGELAINASISTKLDVIDEKDARVIGNNLMPCLKSRKVIAAGVDRWRLQNNAVGELIEKFPWMEDMFVALSTGIVKTAPWGLMLRVSLGASTSMIDLITDIYVASMFFRDGKMGYFTASIMSIGFSVLLQIFTGKLSFYHCAFV